MPWQMQPFIIILAAVLATLAIPYARGQEPSATLRAICARDVRIQCPHARGDAEIGKCLSEKWAKLSLRCSAQLMAEFGPGATKP
jgi:hypothetical protein